MNKVLLSCVALAAGTAMAMAQDLPEYPEKLDFTLNGEKELPGVSVSSKMVPYDGSEYLQIDITGESDASVITMDFDTPEGWDYPLIATVIDDDGSPWQTRSGNSDHWYPISAVTSMGYKKGNSFNFPVIGKDVYASIFLVKGDKVWEYAIEIDFKVSMSEGSGINTVDSTAEARYYNLHGAEVVNPESGIYVKVVDGKSYKVIVK